MTAPTLPAISGWYRRSAWSCHSPGRVTSHKSGGDLNLTICICGVRRYQAGQSRRDHPGRGRFRMPSASRERFRSLRVSMATLQETTVQADEGADGVRRRDFINIAAVSFAGVGAVAVVLPLLNQMNPSADVLAMASTEVDISKITPGQAIKTSWRKQPVFVRNLMPRKLPRPRPSRWRPSRPADARRAHQARQGKLADHAGRLHPSRLRPARRRRGRESRRLRRLFLPVPRFALRHRGADPKGPAPQNLDVPDYEFTRHRRRDRLRGIR